MQMSRKKAVILFLFWLFCSAAILNRLHNRQDREDKGLEILLLITKLMVIKENILPLVTIEDKVRWGLTAGTQQEIWSEGPVLHLWQDCVIAISSGYPGCVSIKWPVQLCGSIGRSEDSLLLDI